MSSMRVGSLVGLLALACGWPLPALAANWQNVVAGKSETIEIDKGSIAPADSGATAWSRIKLDRIASASGAAFDTIHAQNLYDCKARRFTTLRRAYFNGDVLVSEDTVARRRANTVVVGSIDERLFNVACQTVANRDASPAADATGTVGAGMPQGERGVAMHADLRAAASEQKAQRVMPVAETSPVATVEKPKLIVLPPIDKAAAAQAAADSGSAPAPVAKAGVAAPAAATVESAADRRRRELHYANSGPPRSAAKKTSGAVAPADGRPAAQRNIRWSYEGEGGPGNWARLRDDYAICASGKRQSPIDLREGVKVNLETIKFDYRPTQFRIIDNGYTVQVKVGAGLGLTVTGKRYELVEFNFHRPAEERIDGRVYDMSVHLVHRNDQGQLAVVAVLLEKGGAHPLIQTLWNNLPLEQNTEVSPEEPIDVSALLPENRAYWTYMGSLTTPPCTEGVLWMVLKQPVQMAPDQMAIFSQVYRNNARPVQAANGRMIKESLR